MRNTSISLAIFFIFSVFILSCTSPTSSEKASITGRILYADSGNPARGAKVILRKISGFGFSNDFYFHSNTYTNSLGYFKFKNLEDGFYNLYACKYGSFGESNLSHISPLSNNINFYSDEITYIVENIFLYPVHEEGKITGNLVINETQLPADSALVKLWRLEEYTFTKIDSVISDNDGNFQFENVRTGSHCVYASAIDTSYGSPVYASKSCFCNGKDLCNLDTLFLTCLEVFKPAIYIYPEEECQFQVKLILKNSTIITKSIPEYNSPWNVFVEKSGRIDNKYDYLFYEASIKIMSSANWRTGWCIPQKNLKIELNDLLLKIGLNKQETNEFLDYWLKRLQVYKYYKIFPVVNQQLDKLVELKITPPPKTIFRIWLFFQGCVNWDELPSPQINDFIREGTTVIEWGGVMLN
ncbi:MAG: carboxypeptidase regulatory-like domain-containing protein [Candidatus Cloacimonetes bacterium]|nr:carboxypeptidase regulatory-like domain-containing protein [Candidatus Cloacimonadota bacterium]